MQPIKGTALIDRNASSLSKGAREKEEGKPQDQLSQKGKQDKTSQTQPTIEHAEAPALSGDRMVLKFNRKMVLLEVDEIDWIEADGPYVRFHTTKKTYMIRSRLKNVEKQLDPERFVRIHRSRIVNFRRIREIAPHPGRGAIVTLSNGQRVKMSRGYYEKWESILMASAVKYDPG